VKRKIIIIGYDPEIIEMVLSLDDCSIEGYVDINEAKYEPMNIKYLGNDENFVNTDLNRSSRQLIITIDDTAKREFLYKFYKSHSYELATLISKKSNISKFCSIGEGCIIQELTNISFNAKLGKNVKINTGANVMHDVSVGDHSTLAPNSVILGYVKIGNCCFIGSNSTLLPNTVISANSIIGAGSVVTKSLEQGVYTGVPARKLK